MFSLPGDRGFKSLNFGDEGQICEIETGTELRYEGVDAVILNDSNLKRFTDGTLASNAVDVDVPSDLDATWLTYPHLTEDKRRSTAPGIQKGVEISFAREARGRRQYQRLMFDCAQNTVEIFKSGDEVSDLYDVRTPYDRGEPKPKLIVDNTTEYWLSKAACTGT